MKAIKSFVWVLFILTSVESYGFSQDITGAYSLSIHNKTPGYSDTPAEMLITDPQGRRLGYSTDAPFNEDEQLTIFNEIPDARYTQEGIGAASNEDPFGKDDSGTSNFREFYLQKAVGGRYSLQLIGRKTGKYSLEGMFEKTDGSYQSLGEYYGFIVQGETTAISIDYDPTPGTPAPVITKTITFNTLRGDVSVARQLNQLGDDKFARSLVKNIDLAEKLSAKCDKRKHNNDKACKPAVAVLKLVVKRLEKANQKCDSKKPQACEEDKDWDDFDKDHRKDHDYDDFFRDWDRDDWHKDKKKCKRFVSEEAMKIITEDAQWLIKSLGGEMDKKHDDHHSDKSNGR